MRPSSFSRHLNDILTVDGQAWSILADGELAGYAYFTPVPGIENVLDLQGCIDPKRRRQGIGSYLLTHLLELLKQTGPYQLSHAVLSLTSPAALFLFKHSFFIEHIEWLLILESPNRCPVVSIPPGFQLTTYPKAAAIRHFRQMYEVTFQGQPWYQPYTSTKEVGAELLDPADLLFLLDGDKTAGFAWLRMPQSDLGEIEPLGLLPSYQSRGLGYVLLINAIHQLVAQGAERIRIGVWQENQPALHLYQQTGFRHLTTQTYLAYNLGLNEKT
jgi:mycothiol synthase